MMNKSFSYIYLHLAKEEEEKKKEKNITIILFPLLLPRKWKPVIFHRLDINLRIIVKLNELLIQRSRLGK